MSTFRDAIANAVVRGFYAMSGGDPTELAESDISPNSGDLTLADAVLAMPEMEAIRKALRRSAFNAAIHAYPASPGATADRTAEQEAGLVQTYLRHNCDLPHDVIAWVLHQATLEGDPQ